MNLLRYVVKLKWKLKRTKINIKKYMNMEEEKAICELLFDMTGKQMKLKRTKDNIFTSINNIAMNRIKTDKTYYEFKKKFVKMIK